ncbi:MAG: response regulator [Thermoanaerobaculia bacterium]
MEHQFENHHAKVLVVDDDEAIRAMVSKMLERNDFDVTTAENGFEAIERIDESKFDVILLDLMMPRIDGYGVLQHLRRKDPENLENVIVMTAMPSHKLDRTVGRVLMKPFDLSVLLRTARDFAKREHRLRPGKTG